MEPDTENIKLDALNVYEEGHFTMASDVSWSSTNKNVATVDDQGNVELTGQRGRTFITATDGEFEDRIAVDYKVDPQKVRQSQKSTLLKKLANAMT